MVEIQKALYKIKGRIQDHLSFSMLSSAKKRKLFKTCRD